MKNIHRVLSCVLILILAVCFFMTKAQAQGTTDFFDSLYDIPRMPGLKEMPEFSLNFESPQGRVAEAGATFSGVNPADILRFYHQVLPSFGWQARGEVFFVRDGEILHIVVDEPDTPGIVRLYISPSP
ncbi:MAG: hypothetical protein J0L77_06475 [Alphaproteobacteria bacterium]|nr:hypothetical protein [Alphaproteobacteria bacterium]